MTDHRLFACNLLHSVQYAVLWSATVTARGVTYAMQYNVLKPYAGDWWPSL